MRRTPLEQNGAGVPRRTGEEALQVLLHDLDQSRPSFTPTCTSAIASASTEVAARMTVASTIWRLRRRVTSMGPHGLDDVEALAAPP